MNKIAFFQRRIFIYMFFLSFFPQSVHRISNFTGKIQTNIRVIRNGCAKKRNSSVHQTISHSSYRINYCINLFGIFFRRIFFLNNLFQSPLSRISSNCISCGAVNHPSKRILRVLIVIIHLYCVLCFTYT